MTRFEQHLAENLRNHTVAPPPSLREDVFAALDASAASDSSGKSRRWGWAAFMGLALAGSGALWLSESNAPASSVPAPVSVSAPVPVSEPGPVPVSEPVPVSVAASAEELPAASSNAEPTTNTPTVAENAAVEKPAGLEALERVGLQPIETETLDGVTPLTSEEETWHINASVTIKQ